MNLLEKEGLQFIDPLLLKNNLLESIFYLHSQPPLFNLFVGIILKLFPENYTVAFQLIFMFTGLVFFTSFYLLMMRLKVNNIIALILTLYFMVSPPAILIENWLLYTYFAGAWLTLAALFLHKYLSEQRFINGFTFFGLLAGLALLISSFHLFWLIAMIILVICHQKRRWKQILIICAIPFILVLSVYVKNLCLFGSFTLSKVWLGDQLLHVTVKGLSDEEVKRLYHEGKISIYSTTTRWTDQEKEGQKLVEEFYKEIDELPETGIAILDQIKKPSSGLISWHSNARLMIAEHQIRDCLYVLWHYPKNLLVSMKRTFTLYFFPGPTDVTFANRKHIKNYENAFNFMFAYLNKRNNRELYTEHLFGVYKFDRIQWDWISRLLFLCVIMFYIYAVCFGFWKMVKSYHKPNADPAFGGTLLFFIINIFYVTMVMNTIGWFGTNRYRFMLDPFYLTLFALALTCGLEKLKGKVRPE